MIQRFSVIFTLILFALSACSEGEETIMEEGSAATIEARTEKQAQSLEEAADRAMQIEIEAMQPENAPSAEPEQASTTE
ncbi:MAG: hypothetical protein AAGH53_01815 [Pseudomonadota bacterium]